MQHYAAQEAIAFRSWTIGPTAGHCTVAVPLVVEAVYPHSVPQLIVVHHSITCSAQPMLGAKQLAESSRKPGAVHAGCSATGQ